MVASDDDSEPLLQIYADLITHQDWVSFQHINGASMQEAEILKWLGERVEQLMQHSPEKLMAFLYRIDVPEHKVKQAFTQSELPVPDALAHEIWCKLKQTAMLRKKYT